jgi:hypothetical protein
VRRRPGRTTEPAAQSSGAGQAEALEKLGESERAFGIAAGMARAKLMPKANLTANFAPPEAP